MRNLRNNARTGVLAAGAAVSVLVALAPGGAAQAADTADLTPDVSLTAAAAGDVLAPGVGRPGAGDADGGSGFVINVETRTHNRRALPVNESLNIRDTTRLGMPNVNFPGLVVTVDNDLTTPTGEVIPAGTNLASLFNIAGTDDSAGAGATVWAGWHVLESLAPGTRRLVVTATVTDRAGRKDTARQAYRVSSTAGRSGQALTPAPGPVPAPNDRRGPEVSLGAPLAPTRVATGTLPQPDATNGTLFFIQVDALDVAHHGIGVDESGGGTGVIASPTAIVPGGTGAANPHVPGLHFSFDAGLRQPNGNLVRSGENLAALFNVAGSAVGPDGAVRTTLDWVVGGSLVLADGQDRLTMTATVTDDKGGTTTTRRTVGVSRFTSGQYITPAP